MTGHRHGLATSKALNGRRDDFHLFHAHSTLLASVRIDAADGQSWMINTLFVKGLCGRFDSMAYQCRAVFLRIWAMASAKLT